jgi:hypothetical protein
MTTLKVGKRRNQCGGCKVFFNSVTAFDKHRTGEYGVDRRCMTVDEMSASGMSVNEAGYWIGSSMERWKNEDDASEEVEDSVEQ